MHHVFDLAPDACVIMAPSPTAEGADFSRPGPRGTCSWRSLLQLGIDLVSVFMIRLYLLRIMDLGRSQKTVPNEQRSELRTPSHQEGRYLKSIDGVACEFGTVTTLNTNRTGMLLQASRSFEPGNILEVTFSAPRGKPSTTVLEVRWSKPVGQHPGAEHHVGCRILYAASSA